jgi:SNF2 family DNA or RNA helicase
VHGEPARFVRESAKFELLMGMLHEQLGEGRRVLIFSQFATMLGLIARGLQERGIRHTALTGATPDRDRVVRRFQGGEVDVFLISLKAGGTGLTLTRADTVIHYDPWWNPAAQDQATDRAHRIGQDKPVFVHRLIVAGSVEERMLALQQRKRRLASAVVSPAAAPSGSLFGEAEVEQLLAPLDD